MYRWKRAGMMIAFAGLIAVSVAQGPGMGGRMGGGMMMSDSTGVGRARGCGMMMGFAVPKEVIKADDGGLFVVVGNRIIKYDKNLEKRSEAVIEVDTAAVAELMRKMRGQCPMLQSQQQPNMQEQQQEPATE